MRITSFTRLLPALALLCFSTAPLYADENSDALAAVLQRTQALSNITLEYTSRYETLGTPPNLPAAVANQHFHEETINTFRLRNDHARYEKSIDPASPPAQIAITKEITCITPTRAEQARWQSNQHTPFGAIYPDAKQLMNDPMKLIDTALGLRDYHAADWNIAALFKTADIHITPDHLIQLEIKKPNNSLERWTFDPALKDALTRFEIITAGEASILIQCEDFHQTSNIFLPNKITLTNSHTFPPATTPMDLAKQSLVITRAQIADPDNLKDDTFLITWPKATPILLVASRQQMTSDKTQDKSLTDDEIANYAATQKKYHDQLLEDTRRRMAQVPPTAPAN